MPATKFEKGKVKERVDPKVLGVLSAAFGYKISGVDDLDYEEYHNELREAMVRGKDTLSPAQMAVLSKERTRIRAQKSVYKADFKKTTMTAADIKKGSAIQLAENSALSLYKGGVGKSPQSNEETLGDIDDKIDEVLKTLREDSKLEEDKAEAARKKAEEEARVKKEKNLERWTALKKTTSAVVKPFRSLWDKIWGFISKVLLGHALFKLIQWMGDKKNQGKLDNIFRFMKDWWPTMLAAYLLFGNSLGRMIVKLTAKVAVWTVKIVSQLIPQLIAALTKLKTGKIVKMLGGRRGKALMMAGGLLAATPGLVNRLSDGGEEGDTTQKFNQGGVVRGQGGVDKVPAQLTAGEFVMSKGAVQKYGVDTLAAMNAAGGGTNTPTLGGLPGLGGGGGGTDALTEQAKVKTFGSALADFFSGDDGRSRRMTPQARSQEMSSGGLVQGFNGGGEVIQPNKKEQKLIAAGKLYSPIVKPGTIDSYADAIKAGVKIEDEVAGSMRWGDIWFTEKSSGWFGKKKYTNVGMKWIKDGLGIEHRQLLAMPTSDFVNQQMGWTPDSPVNKSTDKLKVGESNAETLSLAAQERSVGVKPPVKKNGNVVTNYKVQNLQKKAQVSSGTGVQVPNFDPEKYISRQKIETLGMTV